MLKEIFGFGKSLIGDGGLIDQVVLDKDQALKLKAGILDGALNASAASDERMGEAILADAKSDSWLQRSWRPILALICGAMIAIVGMLLTSVAIGMQAGFDMSPMVQGINDMEWFVRHVILTCLIYLLGYGTARTVEKGLKLFAGRSA